MHRLWGSGPGIHSPVALARGPDLHRRGEKEMIKNERQRHADEISARGLGAARGVVVCMVAYAFFASMGWLAYVLVKALL